MARLFNSGSQPLVPADVGWGNGVVMPGESFETDRPETYGPPWVQDPEALAALQALPGAPEGDSSNLPSEGVSEAPVSPRVPSREGEPLTITDEGEVVDSATGNVVGYINPAAEGAAGTEAAKPQEAS